MFLLACLLAWNVTRATMAKVNNNEYRLIRLTTRPIGPLKTLLTHHTRVSRVTVPARFTMTKTTRLSRAIPDNRHIG